MFYCKFQAESNEYACKLFGSMVCFDQQLVWVVDFQLMYDVLQLGCKILVSHRVIFQI